MAVAGPPWRTVAPYGGFAVDGPSVAECHEQGSGIGEAGGVGLDGTNVILKEIKYDVALPFDTASGAGTRLHV